MKKKDKVPANGDELPMRDSTAEFLVFAKENGANTIPVRFQDKMLWLTLQLIADLFEVAKSTVSEHLRHIFDGNELCKSATVRNFRTVRMEGRREVERNLEYYSLEAIIAVGYRVNSSRATQFRRWATGVLRDFALRGYVIDRKRMENGTFLGEDYFERLLEEIREIRLSERRFYQKITDIYATAMDYDRNAEATRLFFAKVQNKLHYAVHRHTAAGLIYERADSGKEHMGLTTWEKAPNGRILKSDVVVAKNYLTQDEVEDLGRIVNAYLELAESRAKRRIPMTMEDWAAHLDKILTIDDRELLDRASEISAEIAEAKAVGEYEKFRVKQELEYK
ncbi:MAG: virulence RhuM family protein, partial [Kiritimatiellae bacterium]|nr:virulence RhuM family protein [Kiritimatiellia bacterium]